MDSKQAVENSVWARYSHVQIKNEDICIHPEPYQGCRGIDGQIVGWSSSLKVCEKKKQWNMEHRWWPKMFKPSCAKPELILFLHYYLKARKCRDKQMHKISNLSLYPILWTVQLALFFTENTYRRGIVGMRITWVFVFISYQFPARIES